jgi:hypothetical protein
VHALVGRAEERERLSELIEGGILSPLFGHVAALPDVQRRALEGALSPGPPAPAVLAC